MMNESTESETFEDEDDAEEILSDDGLDVDRVMKDADIAKRRAAKSKCGEPAWRLLERRMEQRLTAELISDFADYDIGDGHHLHRDERKPKSARASR